MQELNKQEQAVTRGMAQGEMLLAEKNGHGWRYYLTSGEITSRLRVKDSVVLSLLRKRYVKRVDGTSHLVLAANVTVLRTEKENTP